MDLEADTQGKKNNIQSLYLIRNILLFFILLILTSVIIRRIEAILDLFTSGNGIIMFILLIFIGIIFYAIRKIKVW